MALETTGANSSSGNIPFPFKASICRGSGNTSQSSEAYLNDGRIHYYNSSTAGHNVHHCARMRGYRVCVAQGNGRRRSKASSCSHYRRPIATFTDLVRLISLTVRSPNVALDLLLGFLEPESARLLAAPIEVVQHFVKNLVGLALNHVDEVQDMRTSEDGLLDLKRDSGDQTVSARLRIDAHLSHPVQVSDHVRLTSATSAKNSTNQRLYSMDAIVKSSDHGKVIFKCLHPLPHYLKDCSWKLTNCGSFVTSQTMIDAVYRFAVESAAYCPIQPQLLGLPTNDTDALTCPADLDLSQYSLNESQNAALRASVFGSLTLLWGPPGTGKSHTIVAILQELLSSEPTQRILVAAPTHNAVDNVMRKYISKSNDQASSVNPIRVSTDVSLKHDQHQLVALIRVDRFAKYQKT